MFSLRSKRFRGVWEQRNFSRGQNTENPVPRSFFAPKPHGNASYAGYEMFGSSGVSIRGEITFQKLQTFRVAKVLMNTYILSKMLIEILNARRTSLTLCSGLGEVVRPGGGTPRKFG